MSDDPQTPSPDDGSDAPFPELSEAELDDVLSQAGSLADQLSDELGHADAASAGPTSDPVSERKDEQASLDGELGQLEDLVTATSHEVGALPGVPLPPATPQEASGDLAPEPPTVTWDPEAEAEFKDLFPGGELPPPPPLDTVQQAMVSPEHLNMPTSPTDPQMPPSASSGAEPPPPAEEPPQQTVEDAPSEEDSLEDDVPDFMKEFMDPDAPPETTATKTEPVIEATPLPVQIKPGVVGTGMLRKVIKPDQGGEEQKEEEVDTAAGPEEPVEVVALTTADALRARLMGLLRLLKNIPSPAPALGKLAYLACDKGVTLLEKVDRPMGRLGHRIRTLIGWIAMATLGTAAVVYVLSLF